MGSSKKLAVVSFCTGYGGLERGLTLAGIEHRVVACVEIEAYVIANLVQKMESNKMDSAPVWTNVKTFPGKGFRGKVDILTGGYPCQPFSVAGQQLGTEDPRHLWPFILQHIKTIKPVQCFFENVAGHINRGLEQVISDLESAGYNSTWGIFSASEVGAPHQRKRVFILADSNRIGSQGEWENSNTKGWEGSKKRPLGLCNGTSGGSDWKIEPELGRVANGITNRVDRIRLLGNGVVPQQAALAYLTLNKRLTNNEPY